MTLDPQQVERDDALSIYAPDPILGKYVSHHPSNRLRLIMIAGALYAIPVLFLQLLFLNVDSQIAAIFLPIVYALIAGAILWYLLHYWNREVVLYERGFSYRRGSQTAYILYSHIVCFVQHIARERLLFFSRMVYNYQLITDIDETIRINNVYSNPDKLTKLLDILIIKHRLPVLERQLQAGETLVFGDTVQVSSEGIRVDGQTLAWSQFAGQQVTGGILYLQAYQEQTLSPWASVPIRALPNAALLIALLKSDQRHADEETRLR